MRRRASQCSKVMRWPHFTLCAAFKREEVTLQRERNKARTGFLAQEANVSDAFRAEQLNYGGGICQLSVGG